MIDAEMTFVSVDAAAPSRGKRMAPLLGLGLGAVVSAGLWAALALTVSHLL
ncbi:hypothetical protein [Caulobacter sp. RHG1]|uniref:hypothetical protein n=1 Tax=Caulobacter sp. (strain RHG1) TaxID=2545762 RepID=UPI0015577486|nr:hypothetical protein [Caulobacter sp. RHG1]NQE62028.1 hypothetical protein [Caulobacter sp. RHG1]